MSFELAGVGFRHRTAGAGQPDALGGVTAALPGGAVSAVLGMSGSGKSTLLNLLGLLWDGPPTAGRIRYAGRGGGDYAALSRRDAAELRRTRFGFVLQSAYLIRHLGCVDNVAVPLALRGDGRRARRGRAAGLLDRAGLGKLAGRSAAVLSGGERQRVAVLRAVAHDPDVLFADEPFASLDPHNTAQLLALLRDWQAGRLAADGEDPRPRTLVLVAHDLPRAWGLVDPPPAARPPGWVPGGFLLLREGKMVGPGLLRPADLLGGPAELERLIAPEPAAARRPEDR